VKPQDCRKSVGFYNSTGRSRIQDARASSKNGISSAVNTD
jgi:hypothetical protein